jgi:hypothetical protein
MMAKAKSGIADALKAKSFKCMGMQKKRHQLIGARFMVQVN